ncbi:tyrosine-protein phosphatase [Pseudonocardia lacus]|uniref:tyrosine-protein phosphatase n=1 Tax=Pseudonocardia lacus TaxID=2835865 RepID=UPI001BDD3689|nr:tyrosine-protein phosphatase [Pseudonocardia lacus]
MSTAAEPVPPLWLDLDGAHNVRDVGGLRAGQHTVRPGVLLRGDHLEDLSPAAAAQLCDATGLRAVVDLRAVEEGPEPGGWMAGRAVERLHLPLVDLTRVSADAPLQRPDGGIDFTAAYGRMLAGAGPALVEILRFVVAPGRVPVLVHCAAGKDRTGIAVALLLAAAGVDEDDIAADYAATGLRMVRVRRAMLARGGYANIPVTGESAPLDEAPIRAVLGAVRGEGGSAEYLRRHGATDDDLARWRALILG